MPVRVGNHICPARRNDDLTHTFSVGDIEADETSGGQRVGALYSPDQALHPRLDRLDEMVQLRPLALRDNMDSPVGQVPDESRNVETRRDPKDRVAKPDSLYMPREVYGSLDSHASTLPSLRTARYNHASLAFYMPEFANAIRPMRGRSPARLLRSPRDVAIRSAPYRPEL